MGSIKSFLIILFILVAFGANAQVNDSIRIIPNFQLNDYRHYRVTQIEKREDIIDTLVMDFNMSVYEMTDNVFRLRYNIEKPLPREKKGLYGGFSGLFELYTTKDFYNFFEKESVKFDLNRITYKVDTVYSQPFEQPLRDMAINFFQGLAKEKGEDYDTYADSLQIMLDNVIGKLSNEILNYLVEGVTEYYGRTFANGVGEIRKVEELVDLVVEELTDDGETVTHKEDLDPYVQVYQTQASIDDGVINFGYKEASVIDDIFNEAEGTFDTHGWPIRLYKKYGFGNYYSITIIQVVNP